MSAGSSTGVGGYKAREAGESVEQFKTSDERAPLDILKELIGDGYIPSYCTACYRMGRTGDRFMSLAKSGNIQYVCEPNALTTLMEYALDYGDEELREKTEALIKARSEEISRDDIKRIVIDNVKKLKAGERDLYL